MNCINADELKSNLERVIKHGIATNGDHTITAEFLMKWVEENSFSVDADKGTSIESAIKWVEKVAGR